MYEHTLVILKPDAINRGLAGRIITRIEEKGFKIERMVTATLLQNDVMEHYTYDDRFVSCPECLKRMKELSIDEYGWPIL